MRMSLAVLIQSRALALIFSAISLLALTPGAAAEAVDPREDPALAPARISIDRQTGLVRFLGGSPAQPVLLPNAAGSADPAAASAAFLELYGAAFGIDDPAEQLRITRTRARDDGGSTLRYRQLYRGLPVIAGELIVNLDGSGALRSMNGEIAPDLSLPVDPSFRLARARRTAVAAVAKWHGIGPATLEISEAELSIYDPGLLAPTLAERALVWRLEVRSRRLAPIREFVLVDATTGTIVLHFNQVHQARDRDTYDANGGDVLPGTLVCSEADPFPGCAGGDADVLNAHDFAGDTYDFYSTEHGRDAIDGAGGTMISSVHWDDGMLCPNAFWNGTQMVYCDGIADGDDVVAHELTHGVTELESGLLYYYQSGAINESLSDVWGELVDQGNGKGDDSPAVRWLMGEDISEFGGAIRDMQDPTAFGDPDRMTSPNYWTASSDSGGVHTNSGVNNKAAYLLTDGDTFNGLTVTGLGATKVAQIYYEAQTNLLTSGADYADLYDVLFQACVNSIGTDGITAGDCDEVRDATDAVEMDADPAGDPDFNPDADPCPSGFTPGSVTFFDDMEASSAWSTQTLSGAANPWSFTTGYASSGVRSLFAPNLGVTSDSVALMASAVILPADAYLHFHHGFGFEGPNWDGGVLEYSTNGSTWMDLGGLFDAGQDYNGTISAADTNPLAGRNGFVDESHGYVSSRYDLTSLSGQNFQLRYRLGSDSVFAGPIGWVVDDVSIHACESIADPSCSGVDVLIQNRLFDSETVCIGDSSLTADTNVTIDAPVTFSSPLTGLGNGLVVNSSGTLTVMEP